MSKSQEIDALIIGTGLAGCSAAYALAKQNKRVLMVTNAAKPEHNASSWAQGGIVYKGENDSPDLLIKDILNAGAGLSHEKAAGILAEEGPKRIEEILFNTLNIPFAKNPDGSYAVTEEAAHSVPRVLYYGDETGKKIETHFIQNLLNQKNIEILTEHTAIDLLTLSHHSKNPTDRYEDLRCLGAFVLDQRHNKVKKILAKETILATGGVGRLYLHTSNPKISRGDGLAMAYRMGARIMNLEYIQFHPTTLYSESKHRFLITEAIRGEGGKLIDRNGKSFMHKYDPKEELAPRDIVARSIQKEMLDQDSPCMYLDISFKDADWIRQRFPSVRRKCLEEGIDITKEPIPIVPAAHYSCGGIATDMNGQTNIRNLWAIGEVACTGLHGANRLASTSLLEDLVWGSRAGEMSANQIASKDYYFPEINDWQNQSEVADSDLLTQDWIGIKHTMWNYVGLVRTPKRLARAQRILRALSEEVQKFYSNCELTDELIGLRNGSTVAQLLVHAALRNPNSRGCHFVKA